MDSALADGELIRRLDDLAQEYPLHALILKRAADYIQEVEDLRAAATMVEARCVLGCCPFVHLPPGKPYRPVS